MRGLKRMALTTVLLVAFAALAGADQWNDKTTLKFDAPIMIPGVTLAPGTYTFQLLDTKANREVVQIFNEDGTRLVATTQAIPTKRMDATGDVVVKLNPTEAGAPAALKAWFYPGSLYGHQFVYPDAQARDIAQRTKTLVLSSDAPDSDMSQGTLHTYDAGGRKTAWQQDDAVMKEWDEWNRSGRAAAKIAAPGTASTRESTAPMMRSDPAGMKVSVGDLEEHPSQYEGKTINVTAEVEDVFGPRLFKIDEPNWADLDGEILVYLPSNLAALVRPADRVTVTGTMKMPLTVDLASQLAWLEPDNGVEVNLTRRPILVASRIVGGNSDVALAIDVTPAAGGKTEGNHAVGTSGTANTTAPFTDAAAVATGNTAIVGRRVRLDGAKVTQATKRGFWIEGGNARIFVLPSEQVQQKAPTAGQSISVNGMVLAMPSSLREKTQAQDHGNREIYIYATALNTDSGQSH